MTRALLILGSGGHAAVLVDILRQQQRELLGLVSPDFDSDRRVLAGIKRYIDDDAVLSYEPEKIFLVNGLGSLPGNIIRTKLYRKFVDLGYQFETVVAPGAIVSPYVEFGQGVQVMPGAIIQAGAKIGENTIVNTGAIIEHDCVIGSHNHIAPGVTLSGQVQTGEQVHIGTGASVIQCIYIGDRAVISTGAAVINDIPADHVAFGYRTGTKKLKV